MVLRARWLMSAFILLVLSFAVHAGRVKVLDIPFNGVQVFERTMYSANGTDAQTEKLIPYIPKFLGVTSSDVQGEWYAGYVDGSGNLLDLSGNNRTLTANGTVTFADSSILGVDGNPLKAAVLNGSAYFSRNHEAWMDLFDTDHTITIVASLDYDSIGYSDSLFSHSVLNTSGMYANVDSNSKRLYGYYCKSGSCTATNTQAVINDSSVHIYHFVRSGNMVHVFLDSQPEYTIQDTYAGYGVDGSATLYLGANFSAADGWHGKILYARIQSSALSYNQIELETAHWQQLVGSSGSEKKFVLNFNPTVNEYGTNFLEPRYSGSNRMVSYSSTWPGMGPQGGIHSTLQDVSPFINNYFTYTESFNDASWTKSAGTSVSTDNAIAPDGTLSAELFTEAGAGSGDVEHCISKAGGYNLYHLGSIFVKWKTGGREWFYIRNENRNTHSWFNIRYCYTSPNSVTTLNAASLIGGDWCRISYTVNQQINDTWKFCTSETSGSGGVGDLSYTGDGRANVWLWGAQLDRNNSAQPTPYTPNKSSQIYAYRAKSIVAYPVAGLDVSKIPATVAASPMLVFYGNERSIDEGRTVTPTTGAYTFYSGGPIGSSFNSVMSASSVLDGNYFRSYGGYLSIADAAGGSDFDFSTAGAKFSVQVVITPLAFESFRWNSASVAFIGKGISGTGIQWSAYVGMYTVYFCLSSNGSSCGTTISSAINFGRPNLITLTYDGTNGAGASQARIYVDDYTTGSSNTAVAPIANTASPFMIGFGYDPSRTSTAMNSKIHYAAVYNNYVISEAEHDAGRAAMVTDGIFPLTMSSTTEKTKIYIEVEAMADYMTKAYMGNYGTIFSTHSSWMVNNNKIHIVVSSSDGKTNFWFYGNDDTTLHSAVCNAPTNNDYRKWSKYFFKIDLTDLTNMYASRDGVECQTYSNNSGSESFDSSQVAFFVGYRNASTSSYESNANIRNVKVWTE